MEAVDLCSNLVKPTGLCTAKLLGQNLVFICGSAACTFGNGCQIVNGRHAIAFYYSPRIISIHYVVDSELL